MTNTYAMAHGESVGFFVDYILGEGRYKSHSIVENQVHVVYGDYDAKGVHDLYVHKMTIAAFIEGCKMLED